MVFQEAKIKILALVKYKLDAALLNTPHCKVRIKGKRQQPREWGTALPYTSVQ